MDIVFPLKVCDKELPDHRDLYITTEHTSHYVYISHFNRLLVRKQLTKHDKSVYICKKCFAYFDNRVARRDLGNIRNTAIVTTLCELTLLLNPPFPLTILNGVSAHVLAFMLISSVLSILTPMFNLILKKLTPYPNRSMYPTPAVTM